MPADDSAKPKRRWPRRVFIATVVALLLGICVVVFFAAYWLYLPVGEGAAGPAVDRGAFEEVWTDRPVLLLGLGDSITAGFGVPASHSYFGRLVENPPDDPEDIRGINLKAVMPNLATLNLAVSGSTSLQHAETQIPKIPLHDEQTLGLVVFTTGGNDIIHDYGRSPPREGAMFGATFEQARPWIDNYESRLGGMLDAITARFPGGCHIFLANIYDPTDGSGVADVFGFPGWDDALKVLDAYNRVIERAAAARGNVDLVDIHTPFLGHGLDCRKFWREHYDKPDPHFWYAPILEDPNPRGYDAVRRVFLIEMARVLGSGAAGE